MNSFDRDKAFVLIQAQLHEYEAGRGFGVDELVEQLEGCVRTVEGITLTSEEARLSAKFLRRRAVYFDEVEAATILAERLEASS